MAQGYVCDAEDCDEVTSESIATLNIDLAELPLQQAFHLALVFEEEGILNLDSEVYKDITAFLQGRGDGSPEDIELSSVSADLCIGHTLTAIDQFGIADIPNQPGAQQEGQPEPEVVEGESVGEEASDE